MPHLNHTGPESKGSKTGRKLGKCSDKGKSEYELGKGMRARRKADDDCEGKGKRLKSGKMFNK